MAFVQANYHAICHKSALPFIPHMVAVRAFIFQNHIDTPDIISFCSSLYMAETTRLKYIAGWERPFPVLTIDSFNRELRNRCFDYYIERRLQDIRITLDKVNRRLHDPSTQECYQYLYNTELQAYKQLKGYEQFPNSAAYARVWKPGTPHILAMAELFLQYLSELIDGTSVITSTPSVEPQADSTKRPIPPVAPKESTTSI